MLAFVVGIKLPLRGNVKAVFKKSAPICSICGRRSSNGTGATSLCSRASSVVHAGGSRSSLVGAREQHERNLEAQGLVSDCACAISGGFTRHTAAVGASLQAGRCYARVGYSMR